MVTTAQFLPCDSHALLEAMEQQSISVAKSGVVTSLRSRTSVLTPSSQIYLPLSNLPVKSNYPSQIPQSNLTRPSFFHPSH